MSDVALLKKEKRIYECGECGDLIDVTGVCHNCEYGGKLVENMKLITVYKKSDVVGAIKEYQKWLDEQTSNMINPYLAEKKFVEVFGE